MKLYEYAQYDGLALAALIKNKEVKASEVALLADQALMDLNPCLNFMAATSQKATRNKSHKCGDFYGVPFLAKAGVAAIEGEPYNMASRMGSGAIARRDDELIRRFYQSGVNILGQSTVPEACNAPTTESVLWGATRNPWHRDYSAGGSSGGAAAAVSAGVVPIAHGGDGAGSIRIPASCCGLVGLKPSRGRTPGSGTSFITALTVDHVLSRTVRDSAAMLDILQGEELGSIIKLPGNKPRYCRQVSTPPEPKRIAFTTHSPAGTYVDAECADAVVAAARVCESQGHYVEEAALSYDWEALLCALVDLYSLNHPLMVDRLQRQTGVRPSQDTRESCNLAMLAHAQSISAKNLTDHLGQLSEIIRQVERFFCRWDLLISPVTNSAALPLGEINANAPDLSAQSWFEAQFTHYASFTPIFNATGQPAMSLPVYQSQSGMPIGVQFASRYGDEATLFQMAGMLEQAMPWRSRQPAIFAGRAA